MLLKVIGLTLIIVGAIIFTTPFSILFSNIIALLPIIMMICGIMIAVIGFYLLAREKED